MTKMKKRRGKLSVKRTSIRKVLVTGVIKGFIRKFFVFLPLALCMLWVISLVAQQKLVYFPNIGFRFSPIKDNRPLIIGLVIFMCGYLLFLSILYLEDLKKFFTGLKK